LIYADSSVIVKRYYAERGSDLLTSRWTTIDRIFTSRVTYAEIHAALARKARDGDLSRVSFRTASSAFEQEWPAYDHILVDEATLRDVRSLVRRHPLRGFDAIHLSAALWLRAQLGRPLEFWASDQRLEAAAKGERFTVVNPEVVDGHVRERP
jgi:predicted nucleic acid-binding protein